MALPEKIAAPADKILRATHFGAMQERLRQAIHTHVHGEDSPRLSAAAIDPRSTLDLASLTCDELVVGGRDLTNPAHREAGAATVQGQLQIAGELTVGGRVRAMDPEVRAEVYAADYEQIYQVNHGLYQNSGYWVRVPMTSSALTLGRAALILVECAIQAAAFSIAARTSLRVAGSDAAVPLTMLATWGELKSPKAIAERIASEGDLAPLGADLSIYWGNRFDANQANGVEVAVLLPAGQYSLVHDCYIFHPNKADVEHHTQRGIRFNGHLTVHVI